MIADGEGGVKREGRVHWHRMTVHPDWEACRDLEEQTGRQRGSVVSETSGAELLVRAFWQFKWEPCRGRHGYRCGWRDVQGSGAEIWFGPTDGGRYATVDLPGEACDVLGADYLVSVAEALEAAGHRAQVTRLDYAFDTCEFRPLEVADRWEAGEARSRAHRDQCRRFEARLELREDGQVGTSGVELGSRESGRFLRVYDRHGDTRVEQEFKGQWAQLAFGYLREVCAGKQEGMLGLLRDFMDFPGWEAWQRALAGVVRVGLKAYARVEECAARVVKRKVAWLGAQVARTYALAALYLKGLGRDLGADLFARGDAALTEADVDLVNAALAVAFDGT